MKKLTAVVLILLLSGGLAACQLGSTPTPAPVLPSATPTITNTALPPTATLTPTAAPIPPLNSPNGPPLSFIKMFTLKDGWGLISNALLVTHDGGVNWFSVPLPQGQVDANTEAYFADMNNLYLLVPAVDGNGGVLYHSLNGGGTWESFPAPFLRGRLIMKFGFGFFLETSSNTPDSMSIATYFSGDKGATWEKTFPTANSTPIPDAGLKTGFSFISSDRGWIGVAGQDQKIQLYRSDDSGNSWTAQQIPEPSNISNLVTSAQPALFFAENYKDGILPVEFVTKDTGDKSLVFYSTNDAGLTWLPGASVIEGTAYTFLDAKNGWAWGKGGMYLTNDGGQTWQLRPVAFGRSEHAICLSFVDVHTGWMLTANEKNRVRIYGSIDGGSTWMAVNP